MKIDNIFLKNFRCFRELNLSLHSQLTVLIANNGQGKSTILDAIRIVLWPFIKSFDLAQSSSFADPFNGVRVDDVTTIKLQNGSMARQMPCEIAATGDWGLGQTKTWKRSRISEQVGTKTRDDQNTKFMAQWAGVVQEQIRDPQRPELSLPMFGYYGTGRLWAQKKLMESNATDQRSSSFFVRTLGYQNCMDPASSYKHFKEWFIWAWQSWTNTLTRTSATHEEKVRAEERIRMVQAAIDTLLTQATGWHTLEFSVEDEESLILSHPTHGRIKIEQMSDGIRNIVALAGDIAYRCIKLNPQLENRALKETYGVVLIDEIDMHLHPMWQQTIVSSLQNAFPMIQFIVTTHSPQVLSTVPSECIRILDEGGVHAAPKGSKGAESKRLLERVFGVPSRYQDDENTQLLLAYEKLVYEDKWSSDEAKQKRAALNEIFADEEPKLTELDLYIENREWELGLEKD